MANEKQLIRAITEPTIILDDIKANTDEQTADEDQDNKKSPYKTVKQMGAVAPAVQISTKIFTGEEVTSLRIKSGGPLPECVAEFLIMDKSFYSRSFPKDGDLMSVFIRNKDNSTSKVELIGVNIPFTKFGHPRDSSIFIGV
jgi:hypothetical protein